MSDPCLFCRIAAGEAPADILYEDERILAFADIHPRAPGHTIVIPRRHAAVLADLAIEDVSPLFEAVRLLSRAIPEALQADGLTIGINERPAAGQAIPHVHVHLLPRFVNDGGGSIHAVVNNPPAGEFAAVLEKIRNGLRSVR